MGLSRRKFFLSLAGVTAGAVAMALPPVRRLLHPIFSRLQGSRTVEERLQEFSAARIRVSDKCKAAGVAYPPGCLLLLGLKEERRLEVYAGAARGSLHFIADYPVLAASGGPGPKLREGDGQVPEGIYALESLNPNSRFHAALRVGYPNDWDRQKGQRDGRANLGGDIMIHGGASSIGCLAMGDPAAQELFVLAAETGIKNVTIVLSPLDLRRRPLPPGLVGSSHDALYSMIKAELDSLDPSPKRN